LALTLALLAGPVLQWPIAALILGGTYLLMLVGQADDRAPQDVRGLAAHVRSLLHGRVTTGILKLVAGVSAAVLIALALGGGAIRVVTSTLVIALTVNVVNALDVRPGRAITWWFLMQIGATWIELSGLTLAVSAYVGGALAVFFYDVRERGMLGDAGSNPLGLVGGTVLAASLPMWGLVAALVVLTGLQIAAETITISRLIERVPPLRWLDSVGRRG
jgi:UDP-GlcNAc:undecaprenyl-phosphate GlcNAc-1-phosphate transferase